MKADHYPHRRLTLVILVLFLVSLACSMPRGGESESDPQSAIETKVAQTMAAEAEAEETPLPSPTFTIQLTETPSLPEPDIVYQGVSFSYGELADSVDVKTMPYQPEEPGATPEYLRFILSGYILPDPYHKPSINVYPVEEYRLVSEFADQKMDKLIELLDTQPPDPDGIVVVAFSNAAEFIGCQEAYVDFQNGRGIRYVTQWGQAGYPIGYPHLFYDYQGLTEDGQYYINVIMPVDHPSLPDTESVTMDQEFYNNYLTYAEETEAQLDLESPESFFPSLLELDAVVETILVEGE